MRIHGRALKVNAFQRSEVKPCFYKMLFDMSTIRRVVSFKGTTTRNCCLTNLWGAEDEDEDKEGAVAKE